ncbi:Mu-like prophage major head subunit gpT family protein [Burkholderia cepacia]|uniref:Mu-like prophage major head subunit gpT family protein n=1 Tax=Burkholderia cepacia TaxID=292 RepID=UPI003EE3C1CF
MIINEQNLSVLYTGLKTAYQQGFDGVKPVWPGLATKVPSQTREEHYEWLGQFPRLREWVGDRVIQNLKAYGYTIKNRKFESTIQVKRDNIEDDSYGLFGAVLKDMGGAAAVHPDELLFELIARGFVEKCYDGMPFFSEHHPMGMNGETTVSNCQIAAEGAEKAPWYLLDTSRALKPFIFQERRPYALTSVTNLSDRDVFMRDEYKYGIDARLNMGFGFWQQAFGSNLELNSDNFDAAYAEMTSLESDEGRPLGIKPAILLCGMSNRKAAFNVVQADRLANNVPNPNYNLVQVVVTQYLP